MFWVISSFPSLHAIDLNEQGWKLNSNCLKWRFPPRVRPMVIYVRASQHVESSMTSGSPPNPIAPTPQHLLLQGGHRWILREMELHNHFSLGPGLQQLNLSASEPESRQPEEEHCACCSRRGRMEGIRHAIPTLSQLTSEIKVYLCRTYSAVCVIADQGKEQNTEFKYMHSRLSCVESRLDDIERNTIEILGKIDSIKEDLSVFISKTQGNQMQEAPSVNQGMREAASFLQQNYK